MGRSMCQARNNYPELRKCGISVAVDGSEDEAINIEGVEDYEVGSEDDEDSSNDLAI